MTDVRTSTTELVDVACRGLLDRVPAGDVYAARWSEVDEPPARCASVEARPLVPPAAAVPHHLLAPMLRLRVGEIALPGWDQLQTDAFLSRFRDHLRDHLEGRARQAVAELG